MIFTTRDLDILRFLRWCRFVLAEDLTDVFSKIEVQNLEILRLIKLYLPAQAYTLTAAGNRLLDAAFPKLPAAVAPAYKAADTIRRIRQSKLADHRVSGRCFCFYDRRFRTMRTGDVPPHDCPQSRLQSMGQHPCGGAAPYRQPHVRDPLGQSQYRLRCADR